MHEVRVGGALLMASENVLTLVVFRADWNLVVAVSRLSTLIDAMVHCKDRGAKAGVAHLRQLMGTPCPFFFQNKTGEPFGSPVLFLS